MKKALCIFLSLLLCASFCACSEADPAEENEKETKASGGLQFEAENIVADTTQETVKASSSAFDFEITTPSIAPIEPVVVKPNTIKFEITSIIPDIDVKSFDSQEFLNDASMNFEAADLSALEGMEAYEVAEIAKIQLSLLSDLQLAFEAYGLAVQIDEKTGEVAIDAAVLFDVDSAEISAEGKQLLLDFINVYAQVVFHEKYDGRISKILIEGHTDSDGEYSYNQTLSQSRADAVLKYILSDECGLSSDDQLSLQTTAVAKGYACDRPILDANGQEDKSASRRVSFRFLINIQ